MSGGLAPSKSTVYISNLPFDLKNNDIHKLFEKYGRIIKVTVLKDRVTRKSKGVAFMLYLNPEDAEKCVMETNDKEIFGRTLKASIAKDNGRAREFIRRKEYPNKSRCYECGEFGHISYKCEKNLLGQREPPPKKVRKRKKKSQTEISLSKDLKEYFDSTDDDENNEDMISDDETLSAAIASEQQRKELEDYRYKVATGTYGENNIDHKIKHKKHKKSAYFSDEEESE